MEPPLHTLTHDYLRTTSRPGANPEEGGGWIGWLATPLGCAVSIILISFFEHSLSCKQRHDETQINHSDS